MWADAHRVGTCDGGVFNNRSAVLYVFGLVEEFAECVWCKTERFGEEGDERVGQVGELVEVFFCYFAEAWDGAFIWPLTEGYQYSIPNNDVWI